MIDPQSPNFYFITDGQHPLRQVLHPESCAKDINLPGYYFKFSDLKKEYIRFKSRDLSRALIKMSDVTKLPSMPPIPVIPSNIPEILAGECIYLALGMEKLKK